MPAQPGPDDRRPMNESPRAVLAAQPGEIATWLRNEPGAWGKGAGQAGLVERWPSPPAPPGLPGG